MILSLLWLHNCSLQSQYLLKFLIQLALLISTMAGITLADGLKEYVWVPTLKVVVS